MFSDILYLVAGIVLLIAGGNYLTEGAVAVARRFKVSSLMIGLTVVALGSSMPDIAVCVESALEGKTAIAVGNIVGADIFDLLLVVGVMALWRPWMVGDLMLKRDLPMMAAAMLALWASTYVRFGDGALSHVIGRPAGLMLILLFGVYMWITIRSAKAERQATAPPSVDSHTVATSREAKGATKGRAATSRRWLSWAMIVGGLGALVVGGDWVVDGASGLALKAGMTEGMVALTVVAIGNSLPDLVTSLTATAKGQPGLAFGNIVGACVIDALLAIGVSSLIRPLDTGSVGSFDFLSLVVAGFLVWLLPTLARSHKFPRLGGLLLAALYVGYMVLVVVRG